MAENFPKASDNDGAWGFSRKDAARIAGVVKRVEAQYRNQSPDRGRYPVGATGTTLLPIAIISNVTAGSEATPSTFSCKVLVPLGATGWTSAGQPTVTGYNRAVGVAFTATAPSPKSAWGVVLRGLIYLVAADC